VTNGATESGVLVISEGCGDALATAIENRDERLSVVAMDWDSRNSTPVVDCIVVDCREACEPEQFERAVRSADAVPVVALADPLTPEALARFEELGVDEFVQDGPAAPELVAREAARVVDRQRYRTDSAVLTSILSEIPQQLYVKDLAARFVRVSESVAEHWDFEPEEMIGMTDLDVVEVRDDTAEGRAIAQRFQEIERYAMDNNEIIDVIVRFDREKWGSTYSHQVKVPRHGPDGEVNGLIGIHRDVTVRRQHEEIVDALNRSLPEILDADDKEQLAQRTVRTASERLAIPDVSVVYDEPGDGLGLGESRSGSDPVREEYRDAFTTAIETGEPQFVGSEPSSSTTPLASDDLEMDVNTVVFDTIESDQSDRPEYAVYPLGDHGAIGFDPTAATDSMFTRDLAKILAQNVTTTLDRIEREARLRDQNERLNEFASIVSHDLRNPLSVAQGHLGLAREDEDPHSLDRVEDALGRMDELIEELLTLATKGENVEATGDARLDQVARRAWDNVATESAELDLLSDGEIAADPKRLQQVFENLFRNAMKHADADEVRVGQLATADSDGAKADTAGFYVEDDILGDAGAVVFQEGVTTEDDGTGYGLYIVDSVARAHDWTIDVRNVDDGGARFEFRNVRFLDS
jgi:PAS domain S-box-containing protein